jgi:hypothetical protein
MKNKKTRSTILLIIILATLTISCSDYNEEIETQEQTYFFLKNETGSKVSEIEPELRIPIYEHLISLERNDDAVNFLSTYNEFGKLIPVTNDLKSQSKTSQSSNLKALTTSFNYGSHSQSIGWQYGSDNSVEVDPFYYELGTTGLGKRLEAYYLVLNGVDLYYQSHIEDIGWQSTKFNGTISGTTGQKKRMEATKIWINDGQGFVYYKSYLQDIGWESSWKFNGQISGTTGQKRRMEAFRIKFYLY